MSRKVSSLRATACFPSPISTDLQLSRFSGSTTLTSNNSSSSPINKRNDPFLMFQDLKRGWHSTTMGVTYVPLPTFIGSGASSFNLTTTVNATYLLRHTAIRYHEDPGHSVQRKLPLFRFKQLAAAHGYEALWEVMCTSSRKHWSRLQRLNHLINDLDAASVLDSELLATFIGFSSMRDSLPARFWSKIRELEAESIAYLAETYSKDKKQKERIHQRYRDFPKKFGNDFFDMSWTIKEQLIMMKRLMTSSSFDSTDQDQFVQCGDAYHLVQDALERSKKILSQRGLARFNPISGREAAERSQFVTSSEIEKGGIEIAFSPEDWFTLQTGEFDQLPYIEFDKKFLADQYTGTRSLTYITRAYIEDLLLNFGYDFPVELTIGTDPGKVGFYFIRLQTNEITQPLLVPYLTGFQTNHFLSSKESLIWEGVIRADIAALIFFETLRVMVANKFLLGCPMRWIPWAVRTLCTLEKCEFSKDYFNNGYKYRSLTKTECCGRIDLLMRLYEAGKKAGFPEQTWRKPIECLSCCSPCQGNEVSNPLPF